MRPRSDVRCQRSAWCSTRRVRHFGRGRLLLAASSGAKRMEPQDELVVVARGFARRRRCARRTCCRSAGCGAVQPDVGDRGEALETQPARPIRSHRLRSGSDTTSPRRRSRGDDRDPIRPAARSAAATGSGAVARDPVRAERVEVVRGRRASRARAQRSPRRRRAAGPLASRGCEARAMLFVYSVMRQRAVSRGRAPSSSRPRRSAIVSSIGAGSKGRRALTRRAVLN